MRRGIAVSAIVIAAACSRPVAEPPQHRDAPAAAPAGGGAGDVIVKVTNAIGTVVVALEGHAGAPLPASRETPVMDQISQTFGPEFLFVRTGERVEFRNSDDTLHNVHVTHEETHEPQFNVAIPTDGSYAHTFKRDGFYRVGCDIHPAMSATIFSAPTPYAGLANRDGVIEFADVTPGPYRLLAYSGGLRKEKDVDVKAGSNTVTLE